MAMTETMRRSIFNEFAQAWGEERAAAFMAAIPTIPWQDFATKADLAALKEWAELKFDAQSAEMHGQFSLLRGEIIRVEGYVSKEIADLAVQIADQAKETERRFADQAKEVAALTNAMAEQTAASARQARAIVFWIAGFSLTVLTALAGGFMFA